MRPREMYLRLASSRASFSRLYLSPDQAYWFPAALKGSMSHFSSSGRRSSSRVHTGMILLIFVVHYGAQEEQEYPYGRGTGPCAVMQVGSPARID